MLAYNATDVIIIRSAPDKFRNWASPRTEEFPQAYQIISNSLPCSFLAAQNRHPTLQQLQTVIYSLIIIQQGRNPQTSLCLLLNSCFVVNWAVLIPSEKGARVQQLENLVRAVCGCRKDKRPPRRSCRKFKKRNWICCVLTQNSTVNALIGLGSIRSC